MSKTIANLLRKLKIKHNLEPRSPLLSFPLSLFKKEEYADLVSIIWLIDNKWVDSTKAPKPGTVMGQVSKTQVSQFFESIQRQVKNLVTMSNAPLAALDTRIYEVVKPDGAWITPTLITHFVSKKPNFILLDKCSKCAHELNLVLDWINGKIPSGSEQLELVKLLESLRTNGTRADSINSLVAVLPQIEPFKRHTYPQRYIYECLIAINKYIASPSAHMHPEILSYCHEVFTLLAKQYPTTLESLLLSLGVTLPKHLDRNLMHLLKQDLRQVPGLTEQQWPELIYYVSLFLYGQAKADIQLINYTYSSKELPTTLKLLAQNHAEHFMPYVAKPEQCKPAVMVDFKARLKRELQVNNLNKQPGLVALFCFENCAPLIHLFVKTWNEQGIAISANKTVALKPSPNQFVLGHVFTREDSLNPVLISNDDLNILIQLHAQAKKAKLPLSDESPIKSKETETEKIEFALTTPYRLVDPTQSDFNLLRGCINDPELRRSISLKSMMKMGDDFMSAFVINFGAVSDFICDYGINAAKTSAPSSQALLEFYKALPTETALDMVIDELSTHNTLIDLENTSSLPEQRTNIIHTLERLNRKLKELDPKSDYEALQKKWLETQVYIFSGLQGKVLDLMQKIEQARQDRDQSVDQMLSAQP